MEGGNAPKFQISVHCPGRTHPHIPGQNKIKTVYDWKVLGNHPSQGSLRPQDWKGVYGTCAALFGVFSLVTMFLATELRCSNRKSQSQRFHIAMKSRDLKSQNANEVASIKNLFMPLFLMGCFPVNFQEVKRPLTTKSGKRPIKVGKRTIKEGKRPIKAMVLVGS